MRHLLRYFYAEAERRRHARGPASVRALPMRPVERAVDLDGRKLRRVPLQMAAGWQEIAGRRPRDAPASTANQNSRHAVPDCGVSAAVAAQVGSASRAEPGLQMESHSSRP